MAKEYLSTAYLKPTGAWLTTANEYYADHPSFRNVDPADTYGTWRLKSSDTPGNRQVANVWEWTAKKCRLCDLDYVVVSADPFILQQLNGEYYSGWSLGKVRLELAVDKEFEQGFFVEWETQKHAEFPSLADTLVDTGYGQNPYGTDPLGSIFGDRTAWFNHGGSYAAEADVSPLCLVSFPSWVTQQASGTRSGIDASFNQAAFSDRLDWPIYLRFLSDNSGQPVTFLRSVMRFGAIGGTPQEVLDYGCQMLRKRWGGVGLRDVCLSLGVHNNVCGASANDTYFTEAITGQDWLLKKRYARVITETAAQNEFLITGRQNTFQRSHPRTFSPSFTGDSAVTALATSPRVLEVNAYSLAGADGVASPKTQSFADAATGPTQLLYQPTHDPRDVGFISSTANQATSFTASRIRSAATLSQPTGQVRALQHDSYAQGKSLQVSVECVVGSVARTDSNGGSTPNGDDDAFLPSVALLERNSPGRKTRADTTGSNPSGWPVFSALTNAFTFVEAERAAEPNRSDYIDGEFFYKNSPCSANLGTKEEFETYIADYQQWRASPTGAGPQSAATPESSFGDFCNEDVWEYVYAELPKSPWLRYPTGASAVTLSNNAGQAVYTASGINVGPSYSPVKSLQLPYFQGIQLADHIGLLEGGNTLLPVTYQSGPVFAADSLQLVNATTNNTSSGLSQTFQYNFWPPYWGNTYDPYDGCTLIPTDTWYGVDIVPPTLPTWQAVNTTTPQRLFSAITGATYTPLKFDCLAFLDTDATSADSILSPAEAVNESSIDKYDALYPAVVSPSKPGDAIVVIHWRRTWKADIEVTAGPVSISGNHTYIDHGPLTDNQDKYSLFRPYTNNGVVQAENVDVLELDETVTVSWPGPQANTKDYTFLFHDQWCTSIELSASEWKNLQAGQAVTVWMDDTSEVESRFNRGVEGDTKAYLAAAGFNYVESGLRPERHTWSVEAQLKITLQFV